MKPKLFIFVLLLLMIVVIFGLKQQNQKFYYAFDEKIYLMEQDSKLVVRYIHSKKSDKKQVSMYTELGNKEFDWKDDSTCIISIDPSEKQSLVSKLVIQNDVISCNPLYTLSTGLERAVTDEFLVKFKENVAEEEIKNLIQKFGVEVAYSSDAFRIIRVPADNDVLDIANRFYETGLTIFSYPNFISKIESYQVPNDTYFANQINFNNTGQVFTDGHSGIFDADIDAPEAWNTTIGLNFITVSVLDEGVTSNHPDLPNTRQLRLTGSNFGDGDANNPSPTGNMNHGNCCAGLIGATQNNNQGITGLAPNCKIMPIRIYNSDGSGITASRVALAIRFAADQGAHVISNSWGYGPGAINPNLEPVIVDAINYATTHGRNGLGCVVVFAASNSANHIAGSNGEVRFPSNVNISGVLTVGASDRYDLQANYSPTSNLGSPNNQEIDVVATSHLAYSNQIPTETFEIWSIDIPSNPGNNPVKNVDGIGGTLPIVGSILPSTGTLYLAYTGRFGGTSAACPQVAATAALMLSINPMLTQQDIFNLITNTADKAGGYNYNNGKSLQFGYGRLNSGNAVLQALETSEISLSGSFLVCPSGSAYSISNLPPIYTIEWSNGSNLTRVSPQNSNPCTFNLNGNGSSWIQAKLISSVGTITLPKKEVWAGKFESTVVTGQVQICPNSIYTYTAQVPGGHLPSYSYSWTYPGNWYLNSQIQNLITLQTPLNPNYGTVRVSITNCNGPSGYSGITVYPGYSCGNYFSLTPNPASDIVNVVIDENLSNISIEEESTINNNMIEKSTNFIIHIYNNQGTLVNSLTQNVSRFSIPLNNLNEGNYIIEINDGKNYYRQHLLIKRN